MTAVLERAPAFAPVRSQLPPRARITIWIAACGALAYSSWPLAFVLNRPMAGSALASTFEARSQPFSWLFILLDCVVGLCTVAVSTWEGRRFAWMTRDRALIAALLSYAVFGLATAVDAVVPLSCSSPSSRACASQLLPVTPDDVLTGVAVLALFVAAAFAVAWLLGQRAVYPVVIPIALGALAAAWSTTGVMVLLQEPNGSAWWQYTFLTLTSVLVLAVPVSTIWPQSDTSAPYAAIRTDAISNSRCTTLRTNVSLADERVTD